MPYRGNLTYRLVELQLDRRHREHQAKIVRHASPGVTALLPLASRFTHPGLGKQGGPREIPGVLPDR
jgi:hypothetical protein